MKKFSFLLILLLATTTIFLSIPSQRSLADENQSGSNSCLRSRQSGKNDNNNCNQQNQNQSQDQTQNNNQNVNITLNPSVPQVQNAVLATSLPSTGTPLLVWGLIGSLAPLGIFLRKITKK